MSNQVSGEYSTVLGGFSNTANANYVLVFGQNVDPSAAETHRVYLFGDGVNNNPSGFLVLNRLDGDHPIHVGTNNTNGNGAHLTATGVWQNASSRLKKDRPVPLSRAEVLSKIRALPVEGWYYRGTQEYHIGPYAEDFYEAFRTGDRNRPEEAQRYLAATDVAGVALIGVQALADKQEDLAQLVQDLLRRVEVLEAENQNLRSQLEAMRLGATGKK